MEIRARNTIETEVKEINQLDFLSNNTKQRRGVPGMFSVLGKEKGARKCQNSDGEIEERSLFLVLILI